MNKQRARKLEARERRIESLRARTPIQNETKPEPKKTVQVKSQSKGPTVKKQPATLKGKE